MASEQQQTGHTPGPWTIRQRTGTPHEYTVSGRRDGRGETVARVKDGDVGRKVANARLIAAAPDLLKALTDARDAIATLDDDALGYGAMQEPDGSQSRYPLRDELLHNIDRAIARATGGTHARR